MMKKKKTGNWITPHKPGKNIKVYFILISKRIINNRSHHNFVRKQFTVSYPNILTNFLDVN